MFKWHLCGCCCGCQCYYTRLYVASSSLIFPATFGPGLNPLNYTAPKIVQLISKSTNTATLKHWSNIQCLFDPALNLFPTECVLIFILESPQRFTSVKSDSCMFTWYAFESVCRCLLVLSKARAEVCDVAGGTCCWHAAALQVHSNRRCQSGNNRTAHMSRFPSRQTLFSPFARLRNVLRPSVCFNIIVWLVWHSGSLRHKPIY